MRRSSVVLAVVLAAALTVGAPSVTGQQLTTLKVGVLPLQSWAPLFIAVEEGYFQRFGIRIEFVVFGSGAESIAPLVDGQLDVGAGAISAAFFNALARGIPVRVVADKGHAGPGDRTNAIVVRKELVDAGTIKTIADLRGRRIAVDAIGSSQHYIVASALRKAGLAIRDVNLMRMPQPAIAAAIEGRAVEAGVLAEPRVTLLAERGTGAPLLYYSDVVSSLQIGVIIYGTNMLQRNRAMGVRFAAAYVMGLRQYAQGKTPRNVAIQAKHTELTPEVLRKSFWFPMHADGRVDAVSLMKMQDWLFEEGLTNVRVPASQFIDQSFLQEAEALLGR